MRALLLLLVVACGRPSPSAESPGDTVFPHTAEFVDTHGLAWKASPSTCVDCHSPKGAEPSAAPACTTCHPAYPHDPDMHDGAVHGPKWTADATACSDCHGPEGDRVPAGSSPGSCKGCHTPYPHDTAWTLPSAHGAAVIAHGGPVACAGCHGQPGSPEVTALCGSCHAAFPHVAGWVSPDAHGAAFLAGVSCGTGCHDGSLPTKVPGCAQCHDVFPHAADWTTGHIPVVQSRGASSCEGCHPPGSLRGPRIPNTCASACHGEGS